MINEQETSLKFGYFSEKLTDGSNQPICLNCDYCDKLYESTKKKRKKSNEFCDKDACNDCRYKKREDVSLARDGVKNSAQRNDVRKKISESGWINSKEFNKKKEATMLEKYGVINPMQSSDLKNKLKQSIIEKYGVDNIMKAPGIAVEASKKSINTKIDRGIIEQIDGKTLPQHAKDQGFSRSHFGKLVKKYGFDEACVYEKNISSLEKTIMNWLDQHDIAYEHQFRIGGKIADIKIGNLLIECDGLYWHSELFLDKNYHFNKRELYEKAGYRGLFFREDEIRDKADIVFSIIKNALGMNTEKYFARKLKVKEIDFHESKAFVENYHLMGPTRGVSCSFGLFNKEELISVIQLKRTKNKNYDIARFCNKSGTTIIGGFSRLLAAFKNTYSPAEISTFIDLRYGTGSYLPELSFIKKTCYPSFGWTDGNHVYHRLRFDSKTAYTKRLFKIWDCGQLKYTLV